MVIGGIIVAGKPASDLVILAPASPARMRNPVISSVQTWTLVGSPAAHQPSPASIAFDLDENVLYCAFEDSAVDISDGSQGQETALQVSFVKLKAGLDSVSLTMPDDEV